MSYTLIPYVVDLGALRQAVGGGDEALLAAILAEAPDEPDDDEELSAAQALRHLVLGEPRDASQAYQYGYALEMLCRHLGEPLAGDCWESIRWAVLEQTGFTELLDQTGPPVDLPPSTDFPRLAHLTPAMAATLLARARGGELRTAGLSRRRPRRSLQTILLSRILPPVLRRPPLRREDRRELLDEYAGWLRTAVEREMGLVFFYY